ncbi:hypothetical protein C8F01DRAFT_1150929 [Mycena amicta]|nr:hypothetical protein C8F01DRAFT_1150929 [Mycena amicta]
MFPSHSYFPTATATASPRDKYLAALADVKAAEAEYLAVERLQQEEDALRYRLQQIQALKQPTYNHPRSNDGIYPRYSQLQGPALDIDIDALRKQIAAEERQRIIREQELEEERRRELHVRKARMHAVGRPSRASVVDILRPFARQREPLKDDPRAIVNLNDVLRLLTPHQPEAEPTVNLEQLLHNILGGPLTSEQQPAYPAASLEQFLGNIFGLAPTEDVKVEPKNAAVPTSAPTSTAQPPQVGLEQLLKRFLGDQTGAAHQVDMSQLFNMFHGGHPQSTHECSKASSSSSKAPSTSPCPCTTESKLPKEEPASSKEEQDPTAPGLGIEQLFKQLFPGAGAGPNQHGHQVDMAQLFNMFHGGHPESQWQPQAECSKASSSKFPSTSTESKRKEEPAISKEEQDLAEAIRLSLTDLDATAAAPVNAGPDTSVDAEAMAPAPAPAVC